MKKGMFFLMMIASVFSFSQEDQIPEGWDKIILEGEVAYMNLINGEVSKTLPKIAAKIPQKVEEFEPTILHYVEKGDTFSKIARKYKMSLSELYRLNSFENFDKIEVGQEVVVGYKDGATTADDVSVYNLEDLAKHQHIVKTNETLYRISKKYNISVNELKILNSLKSNDINIGQKLIVK